MSRPHLLGVPLDPITFEAFLAQIDEWVAAGDSLHQVCTINPEFLVMAQENAAFRAVLQRSALNVIDGWGTALALRWRGVPVPERVTGSDGVPRIVARAAECGWRLFLLGAAEGVAAEAARIFERQHPGVQIVGTYAGSPAPEDAAQIIARINNSGADILLVAYGAPAQDIWIETHRDKLHVTMAMGIGGTLDFVTGRVPRAPRWMRRIGLEWLFRLYKQPWRWRRMLRLPRFAWWAWRYGEKAVP
ncbi:MAG: WecB/TagA/CpsF family glycosyltransferase [Anaerolineales bacterium]